MNIITINGKTYSVEGSKIVVRKHKEQSKKGSSYIQVGNVIVEDGLKGDVHIKFEGDLSTLDCTTATINGNVLHNVDCTTLNCGNIGGKVDATTVNCKDIQGNVDATTVKCNNMRGNIKM